MVGCVKVRDAAVLWKLVLESCLARSRVLDYLTPSIPWSTTNQPPSPHSLTAWVGFRRPRPVGPEGEQHPAAVGYGPALCGDARRRALQ